MCFGVDDIHSYGYQGGRWQSVGSIKAHHSSDHMSDPHAIVVNYICQMVSGQPIRLQEDQIFKCKPGSDCAVRFWFAYSAVHQIFEARKICRRSQTDDMHFAIGSSLLRLVMRDESAGAIILILTLRKLFESLRGTKASICILGLE